VYNWQAGVLWHKLGILVGRQLEMVHSRTDDTPNLTS